MPDLYSTTNLIINNIPSSISDDLLNKLFNKFGSIKSCKIIRINEKDDKTFGFCEYNEPKSAKNALSNLDGYKINERILKVSYAKLFPKPKGKCIEVTNLPRGTHEESVRKYFSQFGRISRLRLISNDVNNAHSKTAEIVFDNKYDAEKASQISSIKWNYDNGKYVSVGISLACSDRSYNVRDVPLTPHANPNAYGNVHSQTQIGDNYFYIQQRSQSAFSQNAFDLSQLSGVVSCGSLGSIYHNAMQMSPLNAGFYPQCQPYGSYPLSHYHAVEAGDKALHSLSSFNSAQTIPYNIVYPPYGSFVNTNNSMSVGIPFVYATLGGGGVQHHIPCKSLAVDAGVSDKLGSLRNDWYNRQIPKNSWVVYVYNIGNSTNGEQLRELFAEKYDKEILRVDVPKDLQNGSNKNFGFITFKSYSSAQLAINDMNGKDFQGKPLQVSFKK